jgi:hypothetical protein
MIIRIRIEVAAEPKDQMYGSYGNLSFNEDASLTGADFTTIAKVFSEMHLLLETVRIQNSVIKTK